MPLAPVPDKPGLHDGDHIRIGCQERLELLDVLEHQVDGRIRVGQVGVRGRAGTGVVDKADDQLEPSAAGGVECGCDGIEPVLIQRPGAVSAARRCIKALKAIAPRS